jgi:hypothetical protein
MSEEFVFEFDKFIDDISRREQATVPQELPVQDITPQREYIRRYRELPQNRTTWRR